MMRKLFYFSLFILNSSFSFGQSWIWGVEGTTNIKNPAIGTWVAINKTGNAYLTGYYGTEIQFKPLGPISCEENNVYLVKYKTDDTALWVAQPVIKTGNTGRNQGSCDALDSAGNIYLVGTFEDTIIFGTDTLEAPLYVNNGDMFIAKYNSNGNVLWARQSTQIVPGVQKQIVVATDIPSNSEYVTGTFSGTIVFGTDTLISTASNVFLVKYDPLGNVVWVRQSTSSGSITAGSVTSDNRGNIYINGMFTGNVEFGADTLKGDGMYLVRYDTNGNIVWAVQSGYGTSQAIVTDISDNAATPDNIYVTGHFAGTQQFGPYSITAPVNPSVFLAKYNSNGTVIWAKAGSGGFWEGTSLSSDAHNHIYLAGAGTSSDTLYFGGQTYTWHYVNIIQLPGFFIKLDTSGNALCGTMFPYGYGGPNLPEWESCISDTSGKYTYLAGSFFDSLVCGPDTVINYNNEGAPYLARWNACNRIDEGINPTASSQPSVLLYPNPNDGRFSIEMKNEELRMNNTIEMYNILGEKVYSNSYQPSANSQQLISINLNQPSGIYLYRIISENGELIGDGKFIIQK